MAQSQCVGLPFGSDDDLTAYRQPISMIGGNVSTVDLAARLSPQNDVAGGLSGSAWSVAAMDEHSVVTSSFHIFEDHF